MKSCLLAVAFLCPLIASCAHPLEKVVDARKQERIEAATQGNSLHQGASDGIGTYMVVSRIAQTQSPDSPAH